MNLYYIFHVILYYCLFIMYVTTIICAIAILNAEIMQQLDKHAHSWIAV